jgi:hypothetical protein
MKPIFVAPLVTIVLAVAGVGAYFAVAGGGSGEEAPAAQPTPTPSEQTPTPTPTPAPTETPTSTLQTYHNEKYGFEVALPEGWRVASSFMDRFAERISSPGATVVPEDYVALTSLNEETEQEAVEQASEEIAIGLAPWYGFAQGKSIHIFPMDVIYPGVTIDSFLIDVDMAGIIRANSEVREESLASGKSAIRVTRREADDNGDFTFDLVIVRASVSDDNRFIIRIVKTADYEKEAFEMILRSFRFSE